MLIPTNPLTSRDLVRRLREIVDRVSDPEYRIRNPQEFAMDYHIMITLAKENHEKLDTVYAVHNLGVARREYIERCLSNE
jgi:hypothetical protein